MKITVIYEDNHLLVVQKPVNIAVQADDSKDEDLLTALKLYLKEKYDKPGNVYLGLVHRLDRPVGGVMVFAKTSKAAGRLSDIIRKNEMEKTYLAVVCGKSKEKDTLTDYLVKDSSTNTSYVTTKEKGKLAVLDYETVASKDSLSLVKVNLHTGRSHQIRVQFSSRKLPLYGDQRYNPNAKVGQQIALFASSISFIHPVTKERVSFSADMPDFYPYSLFKEEK